MNRTFIRSIRLSGLKDFLDHVIQEANDELESIELRKRRGEFETFEELEHLESAPVNRMEIAARAIGQELMNFVESELHVVAYVPWRKSKHKGPKTLMELGDNDHPEKLRTVSDCNINEVLKLINDHYKISICDIDGWVDVDRLRGLINTFKHRNGMEHPRDCRRGDNGFALLQFVQIDVQQAYQYIENVWTFLLALDAAITKK